MANTLEWVDSGKLRQVKEVEEIIDVSEFDEEIHNMEKWLEIYIKETNDKIEETTEKIRQLKAKRDECLSIPDRPIEKVKDTKEVESDILEAHDEVKK